MHYKTEKCGFPIAEVDTFIAGEIKGKKLKETEIEINSQTLPKQTEIWVIPHSN